MSFLTGSFIISVLAITLGSATPLILGALGGVVSERSGVVNIGIEGMMLTAAFVTAVVGSGTNSLLLGIVAGIVAGAVGGLFLAVLSISLRVDQVVGGFVINIAAAGGTSFVFRSAYNAGSLQTNPLPQLNIPL